MPRASTGEGATLASAVALLSYVLLHSNGMPLDPDGWAAWQGAVSLATGNGYTYFSGNPIAAWPPLYSAYLGFWTLVLGPTGWSLLVSNAVLIVVQAFLWMRMTTTIARDSGSKLSGSALGLLSVWVGLVIALRQQEVLAHNLVYCLLPVYVTILWKLLSRIGSKSEVWLVTLLAALGAMLCLAHNAAVVFVVATSAMVALKRPISWRFLFLAAVMLAVPALCTLATRFAFGQLGSHHIGIGAGRYDGVTYLLQFFDGVGRLLVPPRLGAPFVAVTAFLAAISSILVRNRGAGGGLRFAARLTLYSVVLIVVLFASTWVTSPLSATRHILFVVLIVAPLAYVEAVNLAPRLAKALIILALVPQLYWTGLYAMHLETSWRKDPHWAGLPTLVPPQAYISRQYRVGPPVESGAGLLIAPSSFEEPRGRTE